MLLKDNIPTKYVLGKIKKEAIVVSIYAIFVVIIYQNFHITRISIPITVPTVVGTVLSLLLAFRSNQAYDRWWEARTIWGAIVNDSRTLTRQILSFVNDPYDEAEMNYFKEIFVKRQIAWCYCLGQSLRNLPPLSGTEGLLSGEEADFARHYTNKCVALHKLHANDLKTALQKGWINEFQQIEVDRTVSRLCDSMGACERIKNTIFPATYSLYTHFSLILFVALLPFGLLEYFGLMSIPLVIAISSSFFLIEKMAIHLQDPFENKPTDTPMNSIARTIERDLKQMLEENPKADEKLPVANLDGATFYIL